MAGDPDPDTPLAIQEGVGKSISCGKNQRQRPGPEMFDEAPRYRRYFRDNAPQPLFISNNDGNGIIRTPPFERDDLFNSRIVEGIRP